MLKLISVIFTALFFSLASAKAELPPYKIGVIMPLSGSAANFGRYAQNGLTLALDQLSAPERDSIEVFIEDDALDPAKAVSAVRKLVDLNKIDALITWSSGTAKAAIGITEPKGIPMIAIASDPTVAVGKNFSFTFWALPEDEASAIVKALQKQGIRSVAILSLIHPGVLAGRASLVSQLKEAGIQVVFDEEVAPDVKDFRSYYAKLKNQRDLGAFIPILFPGQLALAVKQARQSGVTAPFYGFETFDDPDEIKAADGALEGGIFATGGDPSPEFSATYRARYPNVSMYTASNMYDVLNLLVAAAQTDRSGKAVANYFKSIKGYRGASGEISSSGDNRFKLPIGTKIIKDGVAVNY